LEAVLGDPERSELPKLDAPTLQLLQWLAERPRAYHETMDAWRSSCPRLTVWEDAVAAGLVRVERGRVTLTRAAVASLSAQAPAVAAARSAP
jgi:predicted transcriptional regulator